MPVSASACSHAIGAATLLILSILSSRYDIVRCIYASIDDFQAEPALRQWGTTDSSSSLRLVLATVRLAVSLTVGCAAGNWVSSTLLPAECRALYWNLFQAPEREGRIRPQDIAPMGRRSGPQVSYPLRRNCR